MRIEKLTAAGRVLAAVEAETGETVLSDARSALDLLAAARYEAGSESIVIAKEAVCDGFFILSSGAAGEILQKFINYHGRLAIYGDFSRYTSKPLRDFMYESNQGRDVFFTATREEAVQKLTECL